MQALECEMADEDYQAKLRELQKYVPFLENTIRRLKGEKDRPREAQISKLQSLLSILTDTKKKLKLDALKKCEEVILKLYDKVEKRPCDMINSNKYRCRTPPETVVATTKIPSPAKNSSFNAAREKLKRIETPSSPSPPKETPLTNAPLPIVIPTEKLNNSPVREAFHNIPNPNSSPKKIPTILTKTTSASNLVGAPLQKSGWQPLSLSKVKKRKDLDRPKEHHTLWRNDDYPQTPASREIVDYSDIPMIVNQSPTYNRKTETVSSSFGSIKPIKMNFKKVDKKPKILPISSTISKPSRTESDLLGLLSPLTETSSSGDQSPLHPEELSLDKLEALKAKLYRELEDNKNIEKGNGKENKTVETAVTKIVKPPPVSDKKVKEADNIFGSLLSSIDDQIISQTNHKKEKKESGKSGDNQKKESSTSKKDRDKEKDRRRSSSVESNKKHSKSSDKKSESSKKESTTKPGSDFSKQDKKLMENVLKKVSSEDGSKKDKKLMETVLKNVEKQPEKESPVKNKNSFEEFSNKLMQNVKDAIKLVNLDSNNKKDGVVIKKDELLALEEEVKKDVVPVKPIESKPRITAADIMRDLEESIGITKTEDPLEKFGDLVKQKSCSLQSSSLHRLNMNDEIIKKNLVMSEIPVDFPVSGRLSDKYPHKRKISTDTRVSDPAEFDIGSYKEMLSPKSKKESQAMKLSDPRLSDPRLSDPRLRTNPIINHNHLTSPEPNYPLDRPNNNPYCPPNNFAPVPPPECPYPFGNINSFPPGHQGNQNQSNMFPGRPVIDPFAGGMGNRTPIDPFLNSGNMTPMDPFLNGPEDQFFDGPEFSHMGQNIPQPNGPNFHNNFNNNIDQRNSGNIWDRPPNNFEHNPPSIFQNNFNKRENNQRFGAGNQYDLSQGNSIDFFENQENPEFNRGGGFRGPRGGPAPPLLSPPLLTSPLLGSPLLPLLPVPPRVGGNNFNSHGRPDHRPHNKHASIPDNRRHKTDREIKNKDESSYSKRTSKYNDPRLSTKDERRDRRKSCDERERSSHKSSKSDVAKKPESSTVSNKESVSDVKKNEIYSPLDSLYSGVTKTMGKGYGLQNFKIPKIRKPEVVEIKKEEKIPPPVDTRKEEPIVVLPVEKPVAEKVKPVAEKVKPVAEKVKPPVEEEVPEKPIKQREELKKEPEKEATVPKIVPKRELCSPDGKREESEGANTSKEETEPNADEKLGMFNNFMKHIFDTCNSNDLFAYLDKCGFSLPQSKTKKIRRIIESDSSESEEEQAPKEKVEEEVVKPAPEPLETTPEKEVEEPIEEDKVEESVEDVETSSEISLNPETVIESVGERIKNRRRKPNIIYSSDSSPEKKSETTEMSPPQTPEKRVTRQGKSGRKPGNKNTNPKKSANKTTRRKNALELLQDDIREMFISEGVITATGKRMCRLMKEHHDDFNSSDFDSPVKKSAGIIVTTEDEEEVPLVKRKPGPKSKMSKTGKSSPKPVRVMPKRNSSSPRVVLEKLQFPPNQDKSESENSEEEPSEVGEEEELVTKSKKPAIRKLPSRAKKPVTLAENEFTDSDASPVRKPGPKPATKTNKKTSPELTKEPVESEETDDESDSEPEKGDDVSEKPLVRRKTRKRKGNNWSAGVIKKRARSKPAPVEKPAPPPARLSASPPDDLEIDAQEVADLVADASQDLEQLEKEILNRIKEKSEKPKVDDDGKEDSKDETEDKEVAEADEFDLLKVDLTPDIEYYMHGTEKYNCKLCKFKGRFIVNHYKTMHPESEILISRLSPDQARAAIIEAEQFNFVEIVPYDEFIVGKKRRTNFVCRICSMISKDSFVGQFYDHVSGHTGEHRYQCALCAYNTASKRTLHFHCETKHPQMKRPISTLPVLKAPPNFRIVFGYLCKACNFVQLEKENVEKHIRVSHPGQEIAFMKVSMSSKPVPLTDLESGSSGTTNSSSKNPAEVKKEIHEYEDEDDDTSTNQTFDAAEQNEADVDVEEHIQKVAIQKLVTEKSNIKDQKPVKMQREDEETTPPVTEPVETCPEPQKEPNMTVFMVPEQYGEQEKLIESERLKKMQEVHNNINPKRSTLNVVNRLQNKLANILHGDDSLCKELELLESMEDDAEKEAEAREEELVDVGDDERPHSQEELQASTSSLTESTSSEQQSNQWLSISSACSLATGEQQVFNSNLEEALASESQTQSSDDNESNSEEIDVNQVDLPLIDNKQKGVFDTIHRLAAKLKSSPTAPPSTVEEPEIGNLYYEPPQLPSTPPTPDNDGVNVLNCGVIEIVGSSVHQIFRYKCKVPGCTFQNRFKKQFTAHLSEAHKNISTNCPVCDRNESFVSNKTYNMMNLFVHMIHNHINDLNRIKVKQEPVEAETIEPVIPIVPVAPIVEEVVPPPPQPGTIRIRRISGDVLSSFSSPKQMEVPPLISLENQEVFLHIPETSDHSSENSSDVTPNIPPPVVAPVAPLPFLQISDVRTLTPEEETHLQLKIPEEPSFSPVAPGKKLVTYKPAKLKQIDKAEVPPNVLLNQKLQKIDFAKDSKYFVGRGAKHATVFAKMLKHPQILDLYKCPMNMCSYSTSTRRFFNNHIIDKHKECIAFDAYCVYCPHIIEKSKITAHIDEEHGYCGYQCMNCFYRALTLVYVSLHQKSAHNQGNPKCYSLLSPPTSQNSFLNVLAINQAVPAYVCNIGTCRTIYYITSEYTKHLAAEHTPNLVCSICTREPVKFNSVAVFLNHLVQEHKMGRYQCRYCLYGAEAAEPMLQHYTIDHCNKQPIAYLRKFMKSNDNEPTVGSIINLDKLLKVNLEHLLQANLSRGGKPKLVASQNIVPPAKSSIFSAPTLTTLSPIVIGGLETPSPLRAPINLPPGKLTISNSPNNQLVVVQVEELKDLPSSQNTVKSTSSESSGFKEPLVTLKLRLVEDRTAIENAVDPLNVRDSDSLPSDTVSTDTVDLSDDSQVEIISESAQILQQPRLELSGKDLFRCGNDHCKASFHRGMDFKKHVFKCDISKNYNKLHQCYHCHKQWKLARGLVEHIMEHGTLTITCSICGKKDYHAKMKRHFQQCHKGPCKMVPVDPAKITIFDQFLCVPVENDEVEEINQTIVELSSSPVSPINNKSFKNLFGPDDIDRLPRPPVYAVEVKCKVCSYATKVRSNMLKHLKAHFENKAVSELAPVNPVPCLEKNEMMFEKMTNLAASSQTPSRMGGKKKEDKPESNQEVDKTAPGFIPINKRYVCGAMNCNYLTHGETMLRHHLTALHKGESSYKCPHCDIWLTKEEIDTKAIDDIMFHLKMHDLYLYRCPVCFLYHFQKHKLNRHITDLHKNENKQTEIVRELDSSANVEETRTPLPLKKMAEVLDVSLEGGPVLSWRCGFCSFKCATRTEIIQHCSNEHKIKSQFKCGLCHFRCSVKSNYNNHFKTKHPNEKVNFVSSYYKQTEADLNSINSSQGSSVDEVLEESDKSSFDTTPIWVKNKTGIKHIRGILLDDSKATTSKKIPKVIEKLNELKLLQDSSKSSIDTNKSPVKEGSPTKSKISKDVVRLPDTYGNAFEDYYCCPSCQVFKTKMIKEFISHIYEEINYYRFVCNICGAKFLETSEATNHFNENHKVDEIVTGKTLSVMRFNGRVEKWIEKCLKEQQQEVESFLSSKSNSVDLNSSTETLILNLNDDEDEEEDLSGRRVSLSKDSSDDDFPSVYTLEKIRSGMVTPKIKEEIPAETITTTKALRKVRSPEKKKIDPVVPVVVPVVTEPEAPPLLSGVEEQEGENMITTPAKVVDESPPLLEPQVDIDLLQPARFECEFCEYVGKSKINLQRHVKTHFTVKRYQCDFCTYRGAAINHIQSHFDARHKDLFISFSILPAVDKVPVKRKRSVSTAEVGGPTPAKVPKVVKSEGEDEIMAYMCHHCPRKSYQLQEIRSHYLTMHNNNVNKKNWRYKKITTNKPRLYKVDCSFCDFTGSVDSLRIHQAQEHSVDKNEYEKNVMHKCNLCETQLKHLGQLKKHMTTEHKRAPLSYKTITIINGVESTENIEIVEEAMDVLDKTKSGTVLCEYCPDTFAGQAQLISHHNLLHSHLELKVTGQPKSSTDLKSFQCPECGHSSNSYNAMRDHLRSHNKPFHCGHCNFRGSYPNILKAHHVREHIGLELNIITSQEEQLKIEQLREKLLHLQPDGTYANIKNPKRNNSDVTEQSKSNKVFVMDDSSNNPVPEYSEQDNFISTTSNVAKKSTSKPPQRVAKKSTTPRTPSIAIVEGYSYYGCQPPNVSDYKHVTCELPIMGKNMPLNVNAMSQILNLFPIVRLEDIFKAK